MRKILGAAWPLFVAGSVAIVCYSCKPSAADPGSTLLRVAEQHIDACRTCREAGLTPARLIEWDQPTPCLPREGGRR
jgi:hypothetical protein